MPDAVERATEALLVRRHTHSADLAIPDLTDAQAYAVQAKIVAGLNEVVAGWKVAIVAGRPVGAPLLRATLHASSTSVALPTSVGMKIETEIGFTLARDVPAGPIDRAKLLDAIETIHAVFEIVGARAGEPPAVPFAGFLADNLGNAITVLGQGKRMRAGDTLPEYGWIDCDGERLVEGTHPNGDPLAALQAYAAEQPDALGGLKEGQVIITGSFTSATPVAGGASWRGGFDGLDPVEITFAAGDD